MDGDIDNILSGLCDKPKRNVLALVDDDRCKPLIMDEGLTVEHVKESLSQGNS